MSETVVERVAVPAPTTRDLRRRIKRLAPAALAVLVAVGAAKYGNNWWTIGRFIESTDDAYAGGNVTAVSPHVAGFVAEIPVEDNQHIEAGQLLIRLDPRDFRAALDRAQAIADERQATLAGLEAKYVLQQQMVAQAEAELAAKVARAAFAGEDAFRYRSLALTSYGSRQNAERAGSADQEAQAATKSSEAAFAAARQQLIVLNAEIAAGRASVAQAKADLETARLNLGYTEIRSPIEGYIGNRAAQVGAYVASGAYLLSIIPAHGLWVDANFKEDQLAYMRAPGVWRFYSGSNQVDAVLRSRLSVNTTDAAVDAAIAGMGLARANSYQVVDHVQRGALALTLEAFEPPPRPVSSIYNSHARLPLKLRAFIDFVTPRLRARLEAAALSPQPEMSPEPTLASG